MMAPEELRGQGARACGQPDRMEKEGRWGRAGGCIDLDSRYSGSIDSISVLMEGYTNIYSIKIQCDLECGHFQEALFHFSCSCTHNTGDMVGDEGFHLMKRSVGCSEFCPFVSSHCWDNLKSHRVPPN